MTDFTPREKAVFVLTVLRTSDLSQKMGKNYRIAMKQFCKQSMFPELTDEMVEDIETQITKSQGDIQKSMMKGMMQSLGGKLNMKSIIGMLGVDGITADKLEKIQEGIKINSEPIDPAILKSLDAKMRQSTEK